MQHKVVPKNTEVAGCFKKLSFPHKVSQMGLQSVEGFSEKASLIQYKKYKKK